MSDFSLTYVHIVFSMYQTLLARPGKQMDQASVWEAMSKADLKQVDFGNS